MIEAKQHHPADEDDRPDLADFFSLDREERFFVKNLETVQGDERDAIILSIGYGKSANGDLPHRFGPITQDVGYRRLTSCAYGRMWDASSAGRECSPVTAHPRP